MGSNNINPTEARDIALHFYDMKGWRVGSDTSTSPFSRTVIHAKHLLGYGYTKDEIIQAINYVLEHKPSVFSLGYMNFVMNEVLDKIKVEQIKQQQSITTTEVVNAEDDSTRRNRDKLQRLDSQSDLGKKYNFDLFKEC